MPGIEKKKIPGLMRDPWRNTVPEKAAASAATPAAGVAALTDPIPPVVTPPQADDLETDENRHKFSTIELKGYGGITVEGRVGIQAAAAHILDFCVTHRKEIENMFTEFGVVVAQIPVQRLENIRFYIQRSDGWLIAIPGAASRDAGCLQLIQAMMKLYTNPDLRKKLETAKIRPYKM